jgi:hypothetical protein
MCNGELAEKLAEEYLQTKLPEAEAERFEEHYFGCTACLAYVQALQSAQQELTNLPIMAPQKAKLWFSRNLQWGAAAAVLVAALAALLVLTVHKSVPTANSAAKGASPAPALASPTTAAPQEIAHLADLELPPYNAPNLRGMGPDRNFGLGMKAYAEGNCATALPYLAQVPAGSPQAVAAHFYAGACQFSLHDLGKAAASLETTARAGDSPQLEAALYYLAQVKLARGDAEKSARAQMAKLEQLGSSAPKQ